MERERERFFTIPRARDNLNAPLRGPPQTSTYQHRPCEPLKSMVVDLPKWTYLFSRAASTLVAAEINFPLFHLERMQHWY